MNNIRFINLYSGSAGNCTYIKTPDAEILIDAGRSARYLCNCLRSIGTDISNINAVFITHEHSDHISALRVLLKKYHVPVYATWAAAEKAEICISACDCLHIQPVLYSIKINGTVISSFNTSHDSISSVGYRIDFIDENARHSFGLVTDTGYITEDIRQGLCGCEAVMIESNHDIDMLKCGIYPHSLKQRILSKHGHLSNKDCAAFCFELVNGGTKYIMLAHLSEENNTPELALSESSEILTDSCTVLCVAKPDIPTELI